MYLYIYMYIFHLKGVEIEWEGVDIHLVGVGIEGKGVDFHLEGVYIHSHSHSHNHLSCLLLELPGISRRQVVPASLDPVGPRAA